MGQTSQVQSRRPALEYFSSSAQNFRHRPGRLAGGCMVKAATRRSGAADQQRLEAETRAVRAPHLVAPNAKLRTPPMQWPPALRHLPLAPACYRVWHARSQECGQRAPHFLAWVKWHLFGVAWCGDEQTDAGEPGILHATASQPMLASSTAGHCHAFGRLTGTRHLITLFEPISESRIFRPPAVLPSWLSLSGRAECSKTRRGDEARAVLFHERALLREE